MPKSYQLVWACGGRSLGLVLIFVMDAFVAIVFASFIGAPFVVFVAPLIPVLQINGLVPLLHAEDLGALI